jgi:hypothetical protein
MNRIVKRTITVAALIVALAAFSAPVAAAISGPVPVAPNYDPTAVHTSARAASPINSPSRASHGAVPSDFSWGDATIGAAFAFVVLGLATTTVLATRRGRAAAG